MAFLTPFGIFQRFSYHKYNISSTTLQGQRHKHPTPSFSPGAAVEVYPEERSEDVAVWPNPKGGLPDRAKRGRGP